MKKYLSILLALILVFSFSACDFADDPDVSKPVNSQDDESLAEWSVYWYLCGSDLESEYGCATTDISELLEVDLPDNVNVIIQTGGSSKWQNDIVDPDKQQRYIVSDNNIQLIDEQPRSNMGDPETLADFLSYGKENYPAKKTAVIIWNHGGGSVDGVAVDENYNFDTLVLTELRQAFSSVWDISAENPPVELVGFDACLMATVDVAAAFSGVSRYLVASEETEPGNGWLYSGWGEALAKKPDMDGASLGKAICDTFYEGCVAVGTEDNTTLSVTDLTKLQPLLDAYERFGTSVLVSACEDSNFLSSFARAAIGSENYGGNTRDQGYTNMVDLGHLAKKCADFMTTDVSEVLSALDDCIVYKINGKYRTQATGLSCYYNYNFDSENQAGFANQGYSEAFKYYSEYTVNGTLSEKGKAFVSKQGLENVKPIEGISSVVTDTIVAERKEDGTAVITIGKEAADLTASISFELYLVDESRDLICLLGTDNDIDADWENGVFTDNFRGVWGAIDGHLVNMELIYEGDDYNLYSVPVLINGDQYSLLIAYDFSTEEWSILGGTQGIDSHGMADKNLRLLKEGDVISTIHYIADSSADNALAPYVMDEFTVDSNTSMGEKTLDDGTYVMVFRLQDVKGETTRSEDIRFIIEDGEIYLEN